jgi:hypothetical protein
MAGVGPAFFVPSRLSAATKRLRSTMPHSRRPLLFSPTVLSFPGQTPDNDRTWTPSIPTPRIHGDSGACLFLVRCLGPPSALSGRSSRERPDFRSPLRRQRFGAFHRLACRISAAGTLQTSRPVFHKPAGDPLPATRCPPAGFSHSRPLHRLGSGQKSRPGRWVQQPPFGPRRCDACS